MIWQTKLSVSLFFGGIMLLLGALAEQNGPWIAIALLCILVGFWMRMRH